jgi:hypothetical protein
MPLSIRLFRRFIVQRVVKTRNKYTFHCSVGLRNPKEVLLLGVHERDDASIL